MMNHILLYDREFKEHLFQHDSASEILNHLHDEYQRQWEAFTEDSTVSFYEAHPEFVVETYELLRKIINVYDIGLSIPNLKKFSTKEFSKIDMFMHELTTQHTHACRRVIETR